MDKAAVDSGYCLESTGTPGTPAGNPPHPGSADPGGTTRYAAVLPVKNSSA